MILLDSDTLTHLIWKRRNFEIRLEKALETDEVAVPVFVRAEALRGRLDGLLKAASPEQVIRMQTQLNITEDYLSRFRSVPFDNLAEDHFQKLSRMKGLKKTGLADLLIACVALAQQATLVTCNTDDYRAIPNLKLDNWAV